MWPFKRKKSVPFCGHNWRLVDTFIRAIETDPFSLDFDMTRVPFFVVKCEGCGKQRTLNEIGFAHFRKYFNVKLPGCVRMLKCYHVEDTNGEHQQLVFAEKRSAAILQSEAYEWDGDYIAVRALRQPDYDKYAEQGYVPRSVLLADGWWFTCFGLTAEGNVCGKQLHAEDRPLIINEHVYCDAHCTREGISDESA